MVQFFTNISKKDNQNTVPFQLLKQLQFQVLDILSVNDKQFSVSLSMYFGVHWREERLKLPPPSHNNSGAEWVPIDLDFMKFIWVPNVFVYDIAQFRAIQVLKKLAGIWVVKDKELFYNQVSSKKLLLARKAQRRKYMYFEHIYMYYEGSYTQPYFRKRV